ncbi:MAG: hypothetical protein ABEK12_00285, partial [Candidatus Nanohaloarchaea archaeon]
GKVFLGGWANAGGLLGEAGYGLESAAGQAIKPVSTATERFFRTTLNPQRNRNMAQIVCAYEFFGQGAMFQAASGGAAMSECVKDKLAANETKSKSKKVTQPMEVRITDPRIEPFASYVQVNVPIFNTIVNDVNGVPIDLPARDVHVWVKWHYLDGTPETADRQVGKIPNGDTRAVIFGENCNGDKTCFPTFSVSNGQISDNLIKQKLLAVKDGEETPKWFLNK